MKLATLQDKFGRFLLEGDMDPLARHVKGRDRGGEERLMIHRNTCRITLTEALADNFPVLCRLTGQDFFRQLATAYLEAFPPETPVLSQFGGHLPDFIAGCPALAEYGWLADMARLELALNRAMHSRDAVPLDPAALAVLDLSAPDDLVFRFLPSLGFVKSRYPLERIWRVNQAESRAEEEIDLDDGPDFLLVCRPEWQVRVIGVKPEIYRFIRGLAAGNSLGAVAGDIQQNDNNFQLSEALGLIFSEGLASGISTGRE